MRQSLAITAFAIVLAGYTASVSAATITYTDFSAFQAAAPSLTTETFETAPWAPENLQIQGTSNLGVTWTSADTLSSTSFNSSDLSITSLDGGFDSTDFLQAVLPANITAVGGWVSSFNLDHDTDLRAYDGSDTLLGSISLGNTGNAYAFFGVTSDVEIAKVIFVATNVTTDDDFALDDFAFGGPAVTNPNPVPEPATLTLLGAALGLLGWRRRR